jgi:hypothetical protein
MVGKQPAHTAVKRLPYKEGDWFAVPLGGGGFALGIIARMAPKGRILLGYFFGPKRASMPELAEAAHLEPAEAILVEKFGDPGLIRGEWPLIGRTENWDRSLWPMPLFGRHIEFTESAYQVQYPDDDPNGQPHETRISVEASKRLPSDGLSAYGAIEALLTHLLVDANAQGTPEYRAATRSASHAPVVDHFLYFGSQQSAAQAVASLAAKGVSVTMSEFDVDWQLLVTHPALPVESDLDEMIDGLKELATALGGRYAGYEREVAS